MSRLDLDVDPEALLADPDVVDFFPGAEDDADRATDAVTRHLDRLGLRSIALGGRPRKGMNAYLLDDEEV